MISYEEVINRENNIFPRYPEPKKEYNNSLIFYSSFMINLIYYLE